VSNSSIDALRIAAWNLQTQRWERFGITSKNGVDSTVNSIAIDTSNNFVYLGGAFNFSYDASKSTFSNYYITRWSPITNQFSR
jgi:hypothetical protein